MSHGTQETEIKLAVKDARSARRLLRMAGFVVSRKRVFEANTVFDTPEESLRSGSRLLRIREAGRVATLTYKGEPQGGKHKSRYEKYRTEFHQARRAGVAMLDETPIGVYLELEGTPQWIDRTARRLGFQESDYITASYGRIYLDWCAAKGLAPGDFTFE